MFSPWKNAAFKRSATEPGVPGLVREVRMSKIDF